MRIERKSLISNLWILSVLLYLFRSIAEPLKYPFLLSFAVLALVYLYFVFTNSKKELLKRYLGATKEFHVLGIFILIGIILSSSPVILSIKSLINFLGISFFYLIYYEYREHIDLKKLFKEWIFIASLIGILGILKWLAYISEINIGWFTSFYEHGSSLVTDYNFYTSYFIISMVIYFHGMHTGLFRKKIVVNQAVLFLFILNVALSGSRRGLLVLFVLLVVGVILLFTKRSEKNRILNKNLYAMYTVILILIVVLTSLIPFRSEIIHRKPLKAKITKIVYRYSTIFNPGITYNELYDKFWPKAEEYRNDPIEWDNYASFNNLIDDDIISEYKDLKSEYWLDLEKEPYDNLLYNGDFRYGHNFWTIKAPDSITHEIINSKYGHAIRVSRYTGEGHWPLKYNGRNIVYYKGIAYTFKFKFRVVKGKGIPFKIGWWINEGDGHKYDLPHQIKTLDNEWFEYTASYTFKENQQNLVTFMNSQQENTIVDFTDIQLTCNDTQDRPKYADPTTGLDGVNLFYNSNFENGLQFWSSNTRDTIEHQIVDSPFGKAIRVSRKEGRGYWPLTYEGRELFYHEGITYSFRFKFFVHKGEEVPFRIGWWVNRENKKISNLHKKIYPLKNGWYECIASYKMLKDYYGEISTFMNSQHANTIIDFADIELICDDTLNRPMYGDEMTELIDSLEHIRTIIEANTDDEVLLSNRLIRWEYAWQIWTKDYNWSDKFFGGGFDYLEKYGEKFYPDQDRVDYPHNPIISAFLYSGILGGLFYIYYLVLSFYYYWKYKKQHTLFFILYLIIFSFIFISSDSHFNVPIFALLSLVPFITRFLINEKEQKNPL